jgi:transcription-repair coupling factor (superfamily II helicase)
MSFYRRIADIETAQDKQEIENELIRRFGKINESINNLMMIALLKKECKKYNIYKLEKVSNNILNFYTPREFPM